jgi:hypothetical protein
MIRQYDHGLQHKGAMDHHLAQSMAQLRDVALFGKDRPASMRDDGEEVPSPGYPEPSIAAHVTLHGKRLINRAYDGGTADALRLSALR